MNDEKYLVFTLGPVQGFVAQARRTRDLWAGSFLLSYLSGQAMNAVIKKGGEILKPTVMAEDGISDRLLKAISLQNSKKAPNNPPYLGTLPNQFKAKVPKDFDAQVCVEAINSKWNKIANLVWDRFVKEHATEYTKSIWTRQIENFWEVAWVMADESATLGSENTWLDARKNWRSHYPQIEGGDHCTIMGDWQELSGFVRSHNRKEQDDFWNKIRSQKGVSVLDISEHERLCAISLIKRLYPNDDITKDAIWELDTKHWPSTSYMAASDWIRKVYPNPKNPKEDIQEDNKLACDNYLELIERNVQADFLSEYNTELKGLEYTDKFGKLDGGFFFEPSLENPRTVPFNRSGKEDNEAKRARKKVIAGLKELFQKLKLKPSPYYAILAMDGDRLGELAIELGGDQAIISKSLSLFTNEVSDIVRQNMGETIYAGGDDVLAMLPLDNAITTARQLRLHYEDSFKQTLNNIGFRDPRSIIAKATLSGGLVFANQRITKLAVLREARYLLDDIAKEQNGRDSLAISVLTGSGRSVEWVSTWKQDNNDSELKVTTILDELVRKDYKYYSKGFFYHFRDRFAALLSEDKRSMQNMPFQDIFVAEYLKSREKKATLNEAEARIAKLLEVCYERTREKGTVKRNDDKILVDGALLVRFLITRGLEQ